jgi:N-acetylneuraminic acid mutarotase
MQFNQTTPRGTQGPKNHWQELRINGRLPDRRSYHTSFVSENKLYVFGGLDIQNGSLSSLFELDLSLVNNLNDEETERRVSCAWHEITQNGKEKPGEVAYHSSVVHKEYMYLFGGNNYHRTIQYADPNDEDSAKTYTPLYTLNLKTFTWNAVRTRGDIVKPRDEHTAVLDESSQQMVVFGGFEDGERTNEILIFNLKNTIWSTVKQDPKNKGPCARSGHSACIHGGNMYIFGGKSDNSTKLNDLWQFNISSHKWTQLHGVDEVIPEPRSGHSALIYDGVMLVFGGLFEVTKELNDICGYSLGQKRWMFL